MSGLVNPVELSPLKRAVLALERMQAKLDRYEQVADTSYQVKDFSSLPELDDQEVLDRLNSFIIDYEQLSPLKRAVLALERMQERLEQFEKTLQLFGGHSTDVIACSASTDDTLLPAPLPPLQARTQQKEVAPPILSFAQQRLWFLEQLDPERALYNEHAVLRIRGPLHLKALEQALGEIVRRHEILRTTFPVRGGAAIQFVQPWQPLTLTPVDLRSIGVSERLSQAIKLAEDEVKRPLNIASGPLLRFKLYQLAEDDFLFLLVVHHLVADGWSMGIFFRELSSLYAAYSCGEASPLGELKLQYADYAIWQNQWLRDDVLSAKLDYWKDLLADAPLVLELPSDYARPALQTYRGAHTHFVLSESLSGGLQELSQRAGVTLYTVLLGAFQVLLWHYTRQDDLLVGTPMINRGHTGLEDLIGFFVNTIVVRANLTGNPTFLEFLERVSNAVLAAYAQQDVPFDRLLVAFLSQRDLSRSPLFQVVFSMHQASWARADLVGLTVDAQPLENGRARADLTFEIVEGSGRLEGLVEYSTDLFDETTIARLLEHWYILLESVVKSPQQPISELPILSSTEREQLLVSWNATTCDREARAAHQIFERVVELYPESVAVVFEERHVTYQELHLRSNQLAAYLRQLGVGPDMLVGICVERSLDMLIAVLGVMKAGGAFVPLDPTYPLERLAFLLEDSQVPVLLTQEALLDRLPAYGTQLICLDTDWENVIAAMPETELSLQIDPHNLAYIIYTSGSTGVPKGVMVEHVGINNLVQAQIELFGLEAKSHVLQFASFGFDAWVSEAFTTLLAGATLYLARKDALLPGTNLLESLQRLAITCVTLPPSALAALPAHDLPLLQTIVSAGEACFASLVASWAGGRRFLNAYGPTEATVCATAMQCDSGMSHPPIGRQITNVQIYLLDAALQPVPIGIPGELYIGGAGLARGYLYRPDVTAGFFVPHPFSTIKGARLYKTGDVARYLPDGSLEFLGRLDQQVKVRGFRIELGEIEATLALYPKVQETVAMVREDSPDDKRIVAYVVTKGDVTLSASEAYAFLKERLPDYLIPSAFVQLAAFPLSPHGKVNRQALPPPEAVRPELDVEYIAPRTRIERIIAEIWQDVLQVEQVGLEDNFFELGGHSLIMAQVHTRLCELLNIDLTIVDLFEYPTISALAAFLHLDETQSEPQPVDQLQQAAQPWVPDPGIPALASSDIAIIGLAGRFPGARDIDEFWYNLQTGKESVSFFTEEELVAAGVAPDLINNEYYVPAGAVLEDVAWFDAAFFGYTPREAEVLDPQQRIFLECAWQALETAGYNPDTYQGRIAVFGGATSSTYLTNNILGNTALTGAVDQYQLMLGNSADFLTTRVSYKLNLRGPSVTVLTACSTSLVAVHLACESLRAGKCDMALAGGVSIRFPQKAGYFYQEGGIMSPDGHCRAFDSSSKGIVGGEGVGLVVVKRLADALADGDSIQAVIRGSAMNNDGSQKVGYTAPGVQGQVAVIAEALAVANIEPSTVRYIEAHGTGTPIGDPIEVAALQQVYGSHLPAGHYALGSVKSNIGHLDAAAGVAGLIKTVEALKHCMLPPSLHFTTPNPELHLERSAFSINATLSPWEANGTPRRAAVSSFGIGGTNAHLILEESPVPQKALEEARPWQVVLLSARTETALQQARANLLLHLQLHPDLDLADVAYTLQVGRKQFKHRSMFVCRDLSDAIQVLDTADPARLFSVADEVSSRSVVFMFPGQGTQYIRMGQDLYHTEAVFKAEIDRCAEILLPYLNLDLRSLLYPDEAAMEQARLQLDQTWLTQPALFVVEYALAKLWLSWGVAPTAMIGHSIGEYVAACLADVFPLDVALKLVARRGHLMQQLPHGSMLAIPLSVEELHPLLNEGLSLAAINTPRQCVVAGSQEAIEQCVRLLSAQGISYTHLHTSHAFHSMMVESALETFVAEFAAIQLHPPCIPYISNVSGTWISEAQATSPAYWGQHLRQTVRFADGISHLLHENDWAFLEVGPGRTLGTFVKQQYRSGVPGRARIVVASLPQAKVEQASVNSNSAFILTALGRLWLGKVPINWGKLQVRRRIPLPTYPFERQYYWIERAASALSPARSYNEASPSPRVQVEPGQPSGATHEVGIPSLHGRDLPVAYQPARNEIEQSIVGVWQQLFGISRIGIYDDFFDLGGHSLLATQILSKLRTLLQVELSLNDLFAGGTIAGLARNVEALLQARSSEPVKLAASILATAVDAPLSFAQQRLWLLEQLEPGNPVLNIPLAIRVQGLLKHSLMEQCFQEIIHRQASLRTQFVEVAGEVIQRVVPQLHLPLPVIDLRWLPVSEQEGEVERLIVEEARQPFDLFQAPLMRTTLLRQSTIGPIHDFREDEHVLLLSMHHSVSDGWSMGVFLDEFAMLYRAFANGKASPLPALPMQYIDFVAWQRTQEAVLDAHLDYWCTKLAGELPILAFPSDYPRSAVPSYRGARQRLHLPQTLLRSLKALSQHEGVTFFMVLLGAFQVLLSRYSGQKDILVGTPVANRNRSESEHIIGVFIDRLILRTDLSGDPTFHDLLVRVREVCLEAYTHQEVPFEKLVEVLNPQRDLSRSPLAQVLLRLPSAPTAPIEVADLTLSVLPIMVETADQDLTLDMIELPDGLEAAIEYNTDLFAQATIIRLLRHWQVLLEAVVANPLLRLSQLPLLTSVEARSMLSEWNSDVIDYPPAHSQLLAHQLFERQVGLTPDRLAISLEDSQLSYSELNRRANQLACHLQTLGVGPEVLVGVCMERSVEMIIGMLGVLKAGGVYVPLDPGYPEDRLAFMLEDAQISLLLLQDQYRQSLPAGIFCLEVAIDSDWPQISSLSGENLALSGDAENLAYIIYTSGSTGRPKGVLVSHYGMANLVEAQVDKFGVRSSDHVLQFASASFDASISEMFTTLCTGARLCLARTDRMLPGQMLVDLLCEQQISLITLPPSVLAVIAPETVPDVRTVVAAGEACSADVVQRWARGRHFLNGYGPTEATVCVTIADCSEQETGQPPLGHPISRTQIYILDDYLGLMPVGVVGQLHVGGVGLARGYLNQPALTAERFVPHPFSTEPGRRLYRTGDLARYLADGTIEFLGRMDQQVKVRGYRIELGEIEAVLALHPDVRECAVVVHEEQLEDKRLVAYVVGRECIVDTGELRSYLKHHLPEYMVPGIFIALEALPLTANGKIDRRALPTLQQVGRVVEDDYITPRTMVEELLVDICKEILHLERVSIQDNFFEIGGHSLLAAQVIARIRLALGVEVPVYNVFEATTIAELATSIEAALRSKEGIELPSIVAVKRGGTFPLSFAQQRMWFLDQLQPGNAFYNVSAPFRISGALDVAALEQSLQELVRRHEVLRTTFVMLEEEPVQVIAPSLLLPFPLVDLSALSENARSVELRKRVTLAGQQPFDLAQGPLLRAQVLRITEHEHILSLTLHNSISDGWSRGIVIRELTALYQAYVAGEEHMLPALPIQYADFAVWQRQWLRDEILAKQASYWLQHLSGAPTRLELPTDRPRPAIQTYRGGHQMVEIPVSLTQALKEVSQREGTTLFMAVLATFLVLLSRYSGQEDIVVGTPIASRSLVELEDLIGFFANTLPLRTDLSGNPTFLELLQRIRKVSLGAYAHQDLPFEKLVEIVQPERNLSHSPLFQVMFTLQDETGKTQGRDWLAAMELEIEAETAKFDLNLFLSYGTQGLKGVIEYNTDLFDATTITNLLSHWYRLLDEIVTNPQELLDNFLPLTEEEKRLLLSKRASNITETVPSPRRKVAIAATFTAEPLEESLAWWLNELDYLAEIRFAPYQQLFQQLLDPNSLLGGNRQGLNVLLVRFEDWLRIKDDDVLDAKVSIEYLPDSFAKVEHNIRDLVLTMQDAARRNAVPHLLCICPPSPAVQGHKMLSQFFQLMEELLSEELSSSNNVYVVTSTELTSMYPVDVSYDPVGDEVGHIPYTSALFAALGTLITRKIFAISSPPYKVIAVDCDNTLWKGICGEDGAMGIELSAPYLAFQRFLVTQQEAGMLICLCSKNNEEDVLEVFTRRPEMPLHLKHVVARRINWQAKSQNLHSLAQELQLGGDSFIFIDDNPLECTEVQQHCPEALTLLLPADMTQLPIFLKHLWVFDQVRVTSEDKNRTALYQQNIARSRFQQESPTLEKFLAGLELVVQIYPIAGPQVARVAQLTQRTNQFNFTTRRRSESEILQYLAVSGQEGLVVEVRDRFGDYGKVGVMLFALCDQALVVDSFLMSCRSMGRNVELRMLSYLGARAQELGLERVVVSYLPTKKNQPALDFLEQIGIACKRARADGEEIFDFSASDLLNMRYATVANDRALQKEADPELIAHETSSERWLAPKMRAHDTLYLTARNVLRVASELSSPEQVLQALAYRKSHPSHTQERPVVSRTQTEQVLFEMWRQLLHLEHVGIEDNFFVLGGHSLLATQLLSRIATFFEFRLPLQAIFESPTIVQLATQIDDALRHMESVSVALPTLKRVARDRVLPLSFAQQRLWFLDRLAPGNPSYNLPLRIRLQGRLDIDALRLSLQEIVLRHEVLHTTFVASEDTVFQVITPALVLSLPVFDLRLLSSAEREWEVRRMLKEEWQSLFNLEEGPLLRAMLLRVDAEDFILAITLHHIVFDAWSAGVLSHELIALYEAFCERKPSSLPELPVQYADFAIWQREWLQGEILQKLETYWRERLRGAAILRLPGELPVTTQHSFRGNRIPFTLSSDLSRKLIALSQQEDVTLFMTLLAAFQTLLYRSTGQTDIVVGTDIANRSLSETELLIGFFVNLLVLRTDLSNQPTFRELLKRVREDVLAAYAHQDLPFEKLIDVLQLDRKLNHAPLVRVLFVLQNTPMEPIILPGLTISPVEMEVDTVNFDLVVFIYEELQGLQGVVHYSADVLDPRAVERLVEHFLKLLDDVILHSDVSIDTLAIYSEAEQEQQQQVEAARDEKLRRKLKASRRKEISLPDQTAL